MKRQIARLFCAALIAVVAASCTIDEDSIEGEWEVLEYIHSSSVSSVSELSLPGTTSMSAGKGTNEVFIFESDHTGSVSGVGESEPWSLSFNWSLDGRTLTLDYTSGEPFLGGTQYEVQIFGNKMKMDCGSGDDSAALRIFISLKRR